MSGIAEVLLNLGYRVQGSRRRRQRQRPAPARARASPVAIGHDAENLGDAEVVVVSSAVKRDNPELTARARAAAAGRPPRRDAGRADAPQAVRSRSPARTARPRPRRWSRRCSTPAASTRPSSTAASSTPTAPTPAWAPATGWWSRPTRSDGTFLRLPADVAVVTNIDPEHLDHYGTFDARPRRLPPVRRERAVLRLRRDVHRPSRGAGADRPHRGPPHHHLRRATRRPTSALRQPRASRAACALRRR